MAADFALIGHRGARGLAPENTLLGIETAIQAGVDAVEFDVQLHPDGELLLLHDLRVDRSTNGQGALRELPLATLRALDAGRGEAIPSLEQALERIDRRVWVNIELKTWDGTAQAVAAVLERFLARGWQPQDFLVSSFHLPELAAFRARLPQVPVGALYCGVPLDGCAQALALGAQSLNLADEFLDAELVREARARGLRVYAYTVNAPEALPALRALGLSGVFTDYPNRLAAALRA
ncbi:MAG: glycerophosphodiester phosphodiesterase [Gammaproteobacteria bacterium]